MLLGWKLTRSNTLDSPKTGMFPITTRILVFKIDAI